MKFLGPVWETAVFNFRISFPPVKVISFLSLSYIIVVMNEYSNLKNSIENVSR